MSRLCKIFFICFSSCFAFISCSYLQIIKEKPKARVISVALDGVTPFAIKFKSEVEVENPYDFTIQIDKVDFRFTSENKKLIEGKDRISKSLAPASKTLLPISFQIEYADMGLILNDFLLKTELNTIFESEITISFPNTLILPSRQSIKIEKKEKIKLRD